MQAIVLTETGWTRGAAPRRGARPAGRVRRGRRRVARVRAQPPRHDCRRGAYPSPLPLIPGSDGAGVRRDTGEEVVILAALGRPGGRPGPGFEILGGPTDGTYAELSAAARARRKPARLSWAEAAALPLAGLTAIGRFFSRAGLRADETVLVLGAGSGVSTFAVSLAAQAGARVLVTSSSAAKIERAKGLGAEAGVDYTADDWAAEVRALTGDAGVDVVVDSAGATWPDSLRCLAPGGRLVVFGATARPPSSRRDPSISASSRCSARPWVVLETSRRCSPRSRPVASFRCSTACARSPKRRPRTSGWRRARTSASSCSRPVRWRAPAPKEGDESSGARRADRRARRDELHRQAQRRRPPRSPAAC